MSILSPRPEPASPSQPAFSRLASPGWSGWAALWLVLVAATFATRPLMPIDETRYLGVAWEMWQRGDFLVPHLNGVPYSHKPPLLFWLIHFGWWLFGVGEWWARLVPPLFALANLALTRRLARELWPGEGRAAELAPWVLAGFLAWTFYSTLLLFDMLVVFGVLLACVGLLRARGGAFLPGWSLVAAGIGLGLLAKGPVVLAFVLPPVLLLPWWSRDRRPRFWGWGALGALAGGAAIALAWAVPAAARGGAAYGRAILYGQTTDRLVAAVAHPEPWWWYAAILPLMLFPLALWPSLWRRLRQLPFDEAGVRFCLAASLPGLVILSAISSKQPHYLLSLLPPIALLLARAAAAGPRAEPLASLSAPLAGVALVGLVLLAAPWLDGAGRLPSWVGEIGPGAGAGLVALLLLALLSRRRLVPAVPLLAALSAAMFLALHLGVMALAGADYDLRPVARKLAFDESRGAPIAHLGPYHGQFHFLGRLERPLTVLTADEARGWLAAHPDGRLVAYYKEAPPPGLGEPELAQPFRGRVVGVWRSP